jgi:N-acetylneuraminic acid mutarotase
MFRIGRFSFLLLVGTAFLVSGCAGGGANFSAGAANEWTWIKGSDTGDAAGAYGKQGVASAGNVPGAREGAASWTDHNGNLWLFGGAGVGSNSLGYLNDLWEFSPSTKEWTWVSGSDGLDAGGVYGAQGTASMANVPGGRWYAQSWIDGSGNFWLFGGEGFDASDEFGSLNDLWEFSPATDEWTWVSGANSLYAPGNYGAQGATSAGNVPGARLGAISWIDTSGNLWLFGGVTASIVPGVVLNDLWSFSPSTKEWTWVSGSVFPGSAGVYGTQGIASTANVPSARWEAVSWIDSGGNLWLFGGEGDESNGVLGQLNDLWEFNPATKGWTWVSGSEAVSAAGVYGMLGTPATTNVPGARFLSSSWTDGSGNLWLFGGFGYDSSDTVGYLNDLWEFSPTTKDWTWVSGNNTVSAAGVYGTRGAASKTTVPGARGSAASWVDNSGNLWLMGGLGYNSGVINDLWRYQP